MADKKNADREFNQRDAAASSRAHRDMGSSSQGDGTSDTDRNARTGTEESGSASGPSAGEKGGNTGNR